MGTAIAIAIAVALTVVGALLLVVGRRRDARRRVRTPADARSAAGVAIVVPIVVVWIALAALIDSPATARLHVGLLGLGAAACVAGGSYYVLRYARRTLQKKQGQPWTYDRIASAVLYLLAAGLALTAFSLTTTT